MHTEYKRMKYKNKVHLILGVIILISFIIELVLILKYQNRLTLSSDDLNYVKSAVVLIKEVFIHSTI